MDDDVDDDADDGVDEDVDDGVDDVDPSRRPDWMDDPFGFIFHGNLREKLRI